MADTLEWEKIGVIGVDVGRCWIGDPCYFMQDTQEIDEGHKTTMQEAGINSWDDFLNHIKKEGYHSTSQFNFEKGHAGLGVCVSTGLGDGCYDVFAKMIDVPSWGKRVKEVKIVFIEDEQKDEQKKSDWYDFKGW